MAANSIVVCASVIRKLVAFVIEACKQAQAKWSGFLHKAICLLLFTMSASAVNKSPMSQPVRRRRNFEETTEF